MGNPGWSFADLLSASAPSSPTPMSAATGTGRTGRSRSADPQPTSRIPARGGGNLIDHPLVAVACPPRPAFPGPGLSRPRTPTFPPSYRRAHHQRTNDLMTGTSIDPHPVLRAVGAPLSTATESCPPRCRAGVSIQLPSTAVRNSGRPTRKPGSQRSHGRLRQGFHRACSLAAERRVSNDKPAPDHALPAHDGCAELGNMYSAARARRQAADNKYSAICADCN